MSKRRPLTVRAERYAKGRGRGLTMKASARRAGYKGKRADRNVTGSELERDPRVVKLIKAEMEKSMSADEVQNVLGAQARGESPTKITDVFYPDGRHEIRVERDRHGAGQSVARIHQLFKDGALPPPPPSAPIQVEHRLAGLSDEELRGILAGKLGIDAAALAALLAGRVHA